MICSIARLEFWNSIREAERESVPLNEFIARPKGRECNYDVIVAGSRRILNQPLTKPCGGQVR